MKKVASYEGYDIYFEAEKEFLSMRHHFVTECGWSAEEYKSLSQTRPKWFSAHVVAKKGGIELGESFLGGCCYKTHKEFYTTYANDYFKDMVKDAVAEAENRLPEVITQLEQRVVSLSKTLSVLKESTKEH